MRNLYKIMQEIIIRIRDLIDFESFFNLLKGFNKDFIYNNRGNHYKN